MEWPLRFFKFKCGIQMWVERVDGPPRAEEEYCEEYCEVRDCTAVRVFTLYLHLKLISNTVVSRSYNIFIQLYVVNEIKIKMI